MLAWNGGWLRHVHLLGTLTGFFLDQISPTGNHPLRGPYFSRSSAGHARCTRLVCQSLLGLPAANLRGWAVPPHCHQQHGLPSVPEQLLHLSHPAAACQHQG